VKKLKTIVFKSSAESAVAGLGGHVDVVISSASILLPHLGSGAMRFLAVSASRRLPGALAGVPTLREQGVDAVVDNFRLVMGPPGMAPAQVAYWEQVLRRLSVAEEWKERPRAQRMGKRLPQRPGYAPLPGPAIRRAEERAG
jgi:putative tricarboxylic transport membrane protein